MNNRWLIVMAIVVPGALCGGCASTPKSNEYGLPDNQVVRIAPSVDWFRGRARSLDTITVGGKSVLPGGVALLPGRHEALVTASWSNGFKETKPLMLDALPGKSYWVLIYELQRGQDPATADSRPVSFGEMMLGAGWAGVVQGVMVFTWPLFLLAESAKDVPSGQPFEGCCYVWIEDAQTRDVVAGKSPRGPVAK